MAGCGEKRRYKSEHEAKRMLLWRGRSKKGLRVYECCDCYGFHLTKMGNGRTSDTWFQR